jgi:regulator of protease activity HflC (stomatin/prohibitin superfamily)
MSDSPIPSMPSLVPSRLKLLGLALLGAAMVLVVFLFVLWFVVRQEVDPDEVLILVHKTGKPIPADLGEEFADQTVLYPELLEAIAAKKGKTLPAAPAERAAALRKLARGYKGVRLEVLKEGRHFPNPYSYKRVQSQAVQIGNDEVGVLVRKFGKPLPFPKTVATEPDERGPVAEFLGPGRYLINTLAYEVQRFPKIQIPEGHVGVVTLLSGDEPQVKNTYTVAKGEKGVQHATLRPGLQPYNPYLQKIDIVDIRNRTYHMLGRDAIHFPSNDSFTITIEGTMEWSIDPERVAEVTVAFGDEEDIIEKIILPYTRSISRIEGSKLQAREFISGKTRTAFQERLLEQLRTACGERGIVIHSALVREILPPPEIASLISQREQADQDIDRSRNQIEEAQAEARLVEQQEMQLRNAAIGDARRKTVSLTKEAEQRKVIAVTQAKRQLAVAKLDLESATKQAAAMLARGEADAKVVLFEYEARAEPLKSAVLAFGDGMTYAQHFYLQKIAPAIQSVLSNTEGPFAEIFSSFQPGAVPPAGVVTTGGAP